MSSDIELVIGKAPGLPLRFWGECPHYCRRVRPSYGAFSVSLGLRGIVRIWVTPRSRPAAAAPMPEAPRSERSFSLAQALGMAS